MFAAPSGDKTPPQRNKTGAGSEDVSFEAPNNQQGHACGFEPWRAARPLRASAALRSRRSARKDAASPPRLGDLNELGELVLGQRRGNEFESDRIGHHLLDRRRRAAGIPAMRAWLPPPAA